MTRDIALRRLQIIVAIMMVLGLLIGSPVAQAAPINANPAASLAQLANGGLGDPIDCDDWVTGNLGPSKAQYYEGDSVPYRWLLSNMPVGVPHTIVIEWDTTKSGAHAVDYITSFNRTVTCADPLVGSGVAPGTVPNTFPIPVDPQLTAAGVTPVPGVFSLYNGTITGVSAYSTSGPFVTDGSQAITITFTTSSPSAVLAVGGHIGSRLDWGIGGSATSIPGSPYHMRLLALDGVGGNQDRSLSAGAVYYFGLQVAKSGPPLSKIGDVVTYTFAITNTSDSDSPALVKKSITDDVLGPIGLGQCTSLASGASCTFDVGVTVPITASDPLVNHVTAIYTPTAASQVVSGTASHSLNLFQPSIVVDKTGPSSASVGDTITYSVRITNTSSADSPALTLATITDTLKGSVMALASGCSPLAAGASCAFTYSYVVPTGAPDPLVNTVSALYHPVGFPNNITDSDSHSVDLEFGDLEVEKVVVWNGVTPDPTQAFEICITGPSFPTSYVGTADCQTVTAPDWSASWSGLIPGTYTVTETYPGASWTVSGSGAALAVYGGAEGGASTTITNTHKLGALEVEKVVDWNGVTPVLTETFEICITGPSFPTSYVGTADCQIVSPPDWEASWTGLIPGTYTVTETYAGPEWTTTGSGAALVVSAGSEGGASTTITNTRKLGGLDVTKSVDWNGVTPDTTKTFEICITGPSFPTGDCKTADYDGAVLSWSDLIPGPYTVTETYAGAEWSTLISGSPAIVPVNGGSASATVTNTRKLGGLDVTKVVDWSGVTPDTTKTFEICITGPSYLTGTCKIADYDGAVLSWPNLVPGVYTVTETYAGAQWSTDITGSPATVPANGGSASATVTNTRVLGGLQVTKVVDWKGMTPDTTKTFEICITGLSFPTGDCKIADYDGAVLTWSGLIPDDYVVAETDPGTEWVVSVTGSPATVSEEGGSASATVTNTHKLGSLDVTKVVDWSGMTPQTGQTFEICIAGPSFPNGDCKTADYDGAVLTWSNLIPGVYTVTETDPGMSWSVVGSGVTVTVPSDGGSDEATITNTYLPEPGSIRIIKQTVPDGDMTEFSFSFGSTPFALQDGESEFFTDLVPGTYTITEAVPAEWDLTDVSCAEGEILPTADLPSFAYSATGVAVTLGEGDYAVCTFTNTVRTYTIAGAKWNDADGDGLWGAGEAGLPDWTIELRNANGGLIATTVTAADGSYSFSGLRAGDYRLNEVLQSDWTQTGPLAGSSVITMHEVSLPEDASEGVADGYDFGNYRPLIVPTYDLSGSKWNDADGDGVWDATEVGLAGWEIVVTRGDWVITTTTAADGSYLFSDLEIGPYTVAETQQSGWTQTFPAGGTHSVEIVDADVTDINFGNRIPEVPVYDLSGSKWEDLDGDGTWDAGEPGLAGWTIQLKNAAGAVIGTATTASDGSYSFSGLEAGSYSVSEVLKDGWTQTFPGGSGIHSVAIVAADVTDVNFGNQYTYVPPTFGISGSKWNDDNENALWDTNEPALSGWTIELRDAEGVLLATALTDSAGAYSFIDLEPGTYVVSEVQQTGWKQTFPTGAGTHEVELVEESATGMNFGNYRPLEQPPTPVPCVRSDVAVVIYGGWNDIPVKAWVGGTEQTTLYTALDSFGQQQTMWTFYPPANTSWNVSVQPQTPTGMDPARWQYKLLRIESPSGGSSSNSPSAASVSIRRCNQYVFYFQLVDIGTTPPVAPTPPDEPRLPVTGGGPGPLLAGGLSIFAALSGLGWSIRRRK